MQAFKKSVQRKLFIDKKIRDKTYPTAVTLAKDYESEFNKRVDPRTISSDIAELRQIYKAPIKYDVKKRGYFYSDSSFILNVFEISNDETFSGQKIVKDITIPDWQKSFLVPFMTEVLPRDSKNNAKNNFTNARVTVLPSQTEEGDTTNVENLFLKALENNLILSVEILTPEKAQKAIKFQPLHLVYQGVDCFYFGKELQEDDRENDDFILLNLKRVVSAAFPYASNNEVQKEEEKEIAERHSSGNNGSVYSFGAKNKSSLAKEQYIYYAQTTGNHDIEIIVEKNEGTHIFVFTCYPSIQASEKKRSYILAGEFILNSLE